MSKHLTRRQFVRATSAAVGGAVVLRCDGASAASAGVARRALGKTGLSVSEIGFGGFPIDDPKVLDYAIDQGITYVDTSDDYRGGESERVIGQVMRRRRGEVVLATKWHPWAKTSKAEMLQDLDGSLKRLQTDHVDVIQVHQVGKASGGESVERIKNPALFEAFEQARKQGKARFLGVTGHDGDLMEVMGYALDTNKFQTILCRYNFLDYPEQPALFKRARAAGVGTLAMKTLAGAKGQDLKPWRSGDSTFKQAALRWVLSNPDLSAAVISINHKSQVDEYVQASRKKMGEADVELLERYAARYGREHCTQCNACEPVCPATLPIAAILRHRMYAADYGWPSIARDGYQRLGVAERAGSCVTCPAPCVPACPSGLAVRDLVQSTDRMLGRSVMSVT